VAARAESLNTVGVAEIRFKIPNNSRDKWIPNPLSANNVSRYKVTGEVTKSENATIPLAL
jgi:hypothetical protein